MNTVRGDDAKLRALLARLASAARGDVMRSVRNELGARTAEEIDRSFRERRAPDGRSWSPRKETVGAPLQRSGDLRRGFSITTTDAGVRVTNSVAYATVHQHGGRIRRKKRSAKHQRKFRAFAFGGGVIPPRPMVPTSRWGPAATTRLRFASSRIVQHFFLP